MEKNSTALSTTIVFWIRKLSSLSLLLLTTACASTSQPQVSGQNQATLRAYSVDNDEVTLRVKVKDAESRRIPSLRASNFQIQLDNTSSPVFQLSTTPPPAYIIMLLDFSASMKESTGNSTERKVDAAKAAIDNVLTKLANQPNIKAQIAIVPFAGPDGECAISFPVNKEKLNDFSSPNEAKTKLEALRKDIGNNAEKLCGSTDLYSPLGKAIELFDSSTDTREGDRFHPSNDVPPTLAVILLSDGYHSLPSYEEDFKRLEPLLQRAQQRDISIHTLGYGLTPEELARKYNFNRPITRADLCSLTSQNQCSGKPKDSEFVDRDRLKDIATRTGGIKALAAQPDDVAQKIDDFVSTILGDYELKYQQPDAERGAKHKATVQVRLRDGSKITSNEAPYTFQMFTQPSYIRLAVFGMTLITFLLLGVVPFFRWAAHLRQQAEQP